MGIISKGNKKEKRIKYKKPVFGKIFYKPAFRYSFAVIILAILFFSIFIPVYNIKNSQNINITLLRLHGDVQIKQGNNSEFKKINKNDKITIGDIIKTGKESSAYIEVNKNSKIES